MSKKQEEYKALQKDFLKFMIEVKGIPKESFPLRLQEIVEEDDEDEQ